MLRQDFGSEGFSDRKDIILGQAEIVGFSGIASLFLGSMYYSVAISMLTKNKEINMIKSFDDLVYKFPDKKLHVDSMQVKNWLPKMCLSLLQIHF